MKRFLFILTIVICCTGVYAQERNRVPAFPYPIETVQPDGDTLVIRIIGDEHYHFRTTEDGWLIRQDKRGRYCYAYYNRKGETIASRRQAHNADKRSKREVRYLEKNIPNKMKSKE